MTEIDELLARLWKCSVIDPVTDCWLWIGASSHEYGTTSFNGTMVGVHRLSAHIHLGLDLSDFSQQACHCVECKNKNCWNPKHLYVGNNATNQRDLNEVGRKYLPNQNIYKTHYPQGHEYTEENTYIHKNGSRRCKQCSKDRYRNSRL